LANSTAPALGLWSPAVVVRRFAELLVAANILAGAAALVLSVRGRRAQGRRVLEGGLRVALRDFFYGVERNPAWGNRRFPPVNKLPKDAKPWSPAEGRWYKRVDLLGCVHWHREMEG